MNRNPLGPAPHNARAAEHMLWRAGLHPDFSPTCADIAAVTNPLDLTDRT